MTNKEVKERVLTDQQKKAYKKLRAAWYAKKAELGRDLTQVGFGKKTGWSQSTITQYLTGRIPLNLIALNRFCKELEIDKMDIYPELAAEEMQPEDTLEGQIAEALKHCPKNLKLTIYDLVSAYAARDDAPNSK